ncbi:MAG TPA: sialidase family protein [Thermoanaerobaculia bacterium]|nr:sialidase family protein [Thermoanaerobaculia bacterium]
MLILAAILAIATPTGPGAAEPHVTTLRNGTVAMSWVEPGKGKNHALKFATLAGGKWSAPRVIVERADLLASWADFPMIVEDAKGTLFAQWLQTTPAGARDVYVSATPDGGKTWRAPRLINRDGKPVEHGFVSMLARPEGGVTVAWLDGRETSEGHGHHHAGTTQLRSVELDAALNASGETVVDARVCDCCGTSMARTTRGAALVYRDRLEKEVRDISIVTQAAGKWSAPARVHADDWTIEGCPVNGPQIDARGKDAAVAWFTLAHDQPRVNVAFSHDGGATWSNATRIDTSKSFGHVDVLLLNDDSALVTWIESAGIFARRVRSDGHADAPVRLSDANEARRVGFPRMTLAGKTAFFAWTDTAAKTVRVAQIAVP